MNERKGGPLFKASNDPRVTRIGRLLRDTSIDELPQLWDVLTGRMSLVGPRFAMPKEAAQFDEELQRRTVMRPGITGLWQTEARDNPSFSAYRRLDLLYVDNWSLGLDLAILANTAHSVTARAVRAVLARGGHRREMLASGAAEPSLVETPGADRCRKKMKRNDSTRILIIVQNLPVPFDRRVWLECRTLTRAGYQVAVVCPKAPGDPSYQVIDGVEIYKYRPYSPGAAPLRSSSNTPTRSPPPCSCRLRPPGAAASAQSRAATLPTSSGP